ncbi:hypothetical protein [Desulfovibrio porci]|uniref:hypothetical protein n=1 Tax=Desulfovibrio porci TaxID=2605782 RepID=UPI002A840AAE|nr:hypothetical protein [Desulfovibrio porci]MDY3809889.1 hypothetical protein [Desulfovibrio porci]
MSEFSQIGDKILNETLALFQTWGITVSETRPESGELVVQNAEGQTALISLIHLVEHYYETRDENAVNHFVNTIVASLASHDSIAWKSARESIYYSLHPAFTKCDPPFAREVTGYCLRHYILDTPGSNIWITQAMLDEWGVNEDEVNRRAMENGDRLLAKTELEIDRVEGCALGSFLVSDASLKAALLLAPSFKAWASPHFGWSLYAVMPNKNLCSFFKKSDYPALKDFISRFVATYYKDLRPVSPELLEFGDQGVNGVCSWMERNGYLITFDE